MLSKCVDPVQLGELARQGATLELRPSLTDLERLSACTVSPGTQPGCTESVELAVAVRFDYGPEDIPRIGLAITGQLSLRCQRCLEPLAWPVRIETCLSVLDDEEQTALIASPFDSVLAGAGGLNLVEVIEDEILAALPMAPVHEDGLQCRSAGEVENDSTENAESMQRPFADLASLAGRRKSATDD